MPEMTTDQLARELKAEVGDRLVKIDGRMGDLERQVDEIDVRFQKIGLDTTPAARRSGAPGPFLTKSASFLDQQVAAKGDGGIDLSEVRLGALVHAAIRPEARSNLSATEEKALSGAIGPSGGFTLPEPISSMVIDLARKRARVIEAGAVTMPMEAETVGLPQLLSGVTPTWRAENALVTEDDPAFGRVNLYAHTCAVLTRMSYELFEDMPASAYALIEKELSESIGLAIDYAALRGDGVQKPLGIRFADNLPNGLPSVYVDELGSGNGAAPASYDDILDAMQQIESANGTPTGILTSARTANTYRKLVTGISGDKTKLRPPDAVSALPWLVTNQVPDTLTTGSNADTSEVYVGQWDQLVLGFRPQVGVRVRLLDQTFADRMQVALLAWIRMDTAILHPEHFSVITGVRP